MQEDLFDDDKPKPGEPIEEAKVIERSCIECGTPIPADKNKKAKFCSRACNYRHWERANNPKKKIIPMSEHSNPERKPATMVATLSGLPADAQYIIIDQREKISDLKQELKKYIEKYEEAKEELADLKEQLKDKQTALQGLEEAKPPVWLTVLQSIPQILPPETLSGIVERLVSGGSKAMAGVSDPETKNILEWITQWMVRQPREVQQQVQTIFMSLAESPSQEAMQSKLSQIVNLMTKGSAFSPNLGYGYGS